MDANPLDEILEVGREPPEHPATAEYQRGDSRSIILHCCRLLVTSKVVASTIAKFAV